MNKAELVAAVAEKAEISKKDAEAAVKAFTDVVAEELKKGEKIQLVGFGTFEVSERAARVGRNPQTKQEITIPASKSDRSSAALRPMWKLGRKSPVCWQWLFLFLSSVGWHFSYASRLIAFFQFLLSPASRGARLCAL